MTLSKNGSKPESDTATKKKSTKNKKIIDSEESYSKKENKIESSTLENVQISKVADNIEQCMVVKGDDLSSKINPSTPTKKKYEKKSTTTTTTKTKTKTTTKKPRASKIVTKQQIATNISTPPVTNVILNLKCSMSDLKEYNEKLRKLIRNPLEYNSSAPPEVKYYDGKPKFGSYIQSDTNNTTNIENLPDNNIQENKIENFLSFSTENSQNILNADPSQDSNLICNSRYNSSSQTNLIDSCIIDNYQHLNLKFSKNELEDSIQISSNEENDDVNIKEMSSKLKQLKIQLYKNTLNSEKKSACFWCTYDFDNAPCYIPKYEMDGTIYGYGSFCRPECAVAYLMKESIDDSTKFDRYHLLNQIYSKVYDCKKNIKPAPDPHYLLDKFYGNLNIKEYRRLLKTEHLLLVIDKPLTRILPELHEDTDDAFTKIYGIKAPSGNSSGVYKVKRQSEQPQGPSKASIVKNTFGI